MEIKNTKRQKHTWFVGIDVSKHTLDYAVLRHHEWLFHERRENHPADILAFVSQLKQLPKFTIARTIFCLEASGIYGNHLLNCLKKLKANIVVENPLIIKNFLGMTRGKTDKHDAERIAAYAQKNQNDLIFWTDRRRQVNELAYLAVLRNRLLGISVSLKVPLKEQKLYIKSNLQNKGVELCRKSSEAIKEDLAAVDRCIDRVVNTDANLKILMQRITSVPGVGRITALQTIICTNEFINISEPKKFACYAGIAPFKRESGLMVKKSRVSPFANKKMKSLLHLCALKAVTVDQELKTYFERKVNDEKKPRQAVINAIRNKLILRIFACVKEERCFTPNIYPCSNSLAAMEEIRRG